MDFYTFLYLLRTGQIRRYFNKACSCSPTDWRWERTGIECGECGRKVSGR